MTYAQATDFLFRLEHGSVKLGLERIEAAVAARGHPERRYRTVHVAGTNGKGSTCALLAAILERAGERTGLYTSPHLTDFCERIRIGGRLLPRAEAAGLTRELRPLILDLKLSYFEAATLLAFEAFARRGVTCAVIEVGMGGRLDATNVVRPELTVVTGIDWDHRQALGSTLTAIAGEKAGIMKPGVPLLHGPCRAAVAEVFRRRGREVGAPVMPLRGRLSGWSARPLPSGTRIDWRRADGSRGEYRIGLRGAHQAQNALLAAEAARLLARRGRPVPEAAIGEGLALGRWPGRCELLAPSGRRPAVVLDVAHNRQGARALREAWEGWFSALPPPALIVGMLGDKDHEAFLRELRPLAPEALLVPLDSPRAGPLGDLAAAARRAGLKPRPCAGMAEAWARRPGGRPVLVTGSFLTVDAAMRLLGRRAARSLFPGAAPAGGPGAGARGGSARARG
ncbi:MAG: bifunctional folylpolyglutamate synthase/dihydrofolate synthase [Candidatus Eisenbacteria bacterium]|uniref:tetrahydrofolate synthase n=1 Tax=Eiseniibacteriota bacterium TaxID=2212470 RepID=A0A937XAL9_UNCEI|nr:bifunctional folylpolyglutamate synthase/dihydrofolate synthase [Candidatus Eisenbacteria bacterium]